MELLRRAMATRPYHGLKPTAVVRVRADSGHWYYLSAYSDKASMVELVEILSLRYPGRPVEVVLDRLGGGDSW
jgi:hypothetical protein